MAIPNSAHAIWLPKCQLDFFFFFKPTIKHLKKKKHVGNFGKNEGSSTSFRFFFLPFWVFRLSPFPFSKGTASSAEITPSWLASIRWKSAASSRKAQGTEGRWSGAASVYSFFCLIFCIYIYISKGFFL